MQYWKDIDQVVIYNMELMSHHGSLEQPQTSMIRKRNSSCNWGATGCIEFLQTIKITYSKQRLVRDINKLKQKYRQRRMFYLRLSRNLKSKSLKLNAEWKLTTPTIMDCISHIIKMESELERNPSRKPTFDKAERPDRMKRYPHKLSNQMKRTNISA